MPFAFQVHHRERNLRRSELEASLDTQEDGHNDSLSGKSIGLLLLELHVIKS